MRGDAPSCGLLTERQEPERNVFYATSDVLVQMAHKHSSFWNDPGLIGELGRIFRILVLVTHLYAFSFM